MDRFVTKTPTWKTLNYNSMAAQSAVQRMSLSKKPPSDNKKKPLQEKQLNRVPDFSRCNDDLLPSNQAIENFNGNSNDSGLSSASSISPQQTNDNCCAKSFDNQLPPKINHIG